MANTYVGNIISELEVMDDGTELIELYVWSNGKSIRKYTGQEKLLDTYEHIKHDPRKGFKKYKAILIPVED